MLDKPQYGEEEPKPQLKCESCGFWSYDERDWISIDDTGKCRSCSKYL